MPSQPCCRTFLWHQRNASKRRMSHHHRGSRKAITDGAQALSGVPGRICKIDWNGDAAFPKRYTNQCDLSCCDIHRFYGIGLWLEVLLDATNKSDPAHHARRSFYICMHFATRISSSTSVTQECYFVTTRQRARFRDGAYGGGTWACM